MVLQMDTMLQSGHAVNSWEGYETVDHFDSSYHVLKWIRRESKNSYLLGLRALRARKGCMGRVSLCAASSPPL